ncbi:MAG TPA: HNH endonuclease signature motif containing protein [Actinokineospora sp.]|jgi:hypothetical protein|nr:HNH endonuclease signature motif containing protein [Actinokineospora sp.]
MRCSRCGTTTGVRPYIVQWPRKAFLCRTHAAAHFKATRRDALARTRAQYGDLAAREDQAHAHHIALRADTIGRLAIADVGVRTTTGRLLDVLARTSRRYFAEWDDQAHRAFGSARERSRAAGHKIRAADRHAHAIPVDTPWLRRVYRDRCIYCGDRVAHIDHVWPLVAGGDDAPWNLAPSCARCNLSKGGKSLAEWWPGHWAALNEIERVRAGALWDSLLTG